MGRGPGGAQRTDLRLTGSLGGAFRERRQDEHQRAANGLGQRGHLCCAVGVDGVQLLRRGGVVHAPGHMHDHISTLGNAVMTLPRRPGRGALRSIAACSGALQHAAAGEGHHLERAGQQRVPADPATPDIPVTSASLPVPHDGSTSLDDRPVRVAGQPLTWTTTTPFAEGGANEGDHQPFVEEGNARHDEGERNDARVEVQYGVPGACPARAAHSVFAEGRHVSPPLAVQFPQVSAAFLLRFSTKRTAIPHCEAPLSSPYCRSAPSLTAIIARGLRRWTEKPAGHQSKSQHRDPDRVRTRRGCALPAGVALSRRR